VGLVAVPIMIACHSWISPTLSFKPRICHDSEPILLTENFISFRLLSLFW